MGAYPVGFEGKISIGALDIFNGGEKGQWGHGSGSMGVLKRVNVGIGQGGSMGASASMGVLKRVRVNGGIEQWGLNGGIEKNQ